MASNHTRTYEWSTVDLKESRVYNDNGSMSQENSSLDWFSQYVNNEGDRRSKILRYDLMDRRSVEVSRALDIIAEDFSSSNADNEDVFELDFENAPKMKKTHIKILDYFKDTWSRRNDFNTKLYDYGRELFKYGGIFFLKRADGTLKKISQEQLVGYVLDVNDRNVVTHYLADWNAVLLNTAETHQTVEQIKQNSERKIEHIPVESMVVIRRGNSPFGDSILERAFPIWRKLDLLETAVVIHRFTRSVDRRVYYIDVGRLPPKKHKEVVDKYRLEMRQKRIMNKSGDVNSEFDPHSMSEDYFVPVTSQGRSSKIEQLQGSASPGGLEDLTYLARKLAAAMRVPPSMTDTQNEGNDRDTYSDMRVGQVYQIEMRYLGFIGRTKKIAEKELRKHFLWFCTERDVELPDEVMIRINESHNFALYKNIETHQALMNVYQSTSQMPTLGKRFAMKKYLALTEEELIENESTVLREKGVDDETIKKMTEVEIDNIVYGDGRLGEKYGLTASEEGGFGGRF